MPPFSTLLALTPGARLGAYEILALLGSGGMGEVYRARDTRLGRDVALKILPDSFTRDPERVARFRREAQVLASLNHPHIAQIHGLDEANGVQFLILELVDGESLDKRIARGSIAVDEAIGIASQIAEALEAANNKGIIHRDLKPANIALTADGQAKVLDFGLAKASEAAGSAVDLANSPTLTSPAMMTGLGVILGTAAYMSPEQAKGRAVDRRSDVWAFGCVLYEMLTGRRAFAGDDVSDTLAAVLKESPRWDQLPAAFDPAIRTLLERCLEKDRQKRVADFAVVRYVFNERASVRATAGEVAPRSPRLRAALPWAVAGVLAAALLAVVAVFPRPGNRPSITPLRLTAEIGAGLSLIPSTGPAAALAPDGGLMAFIGGENATGSSRLYIRRLDQLRATAIPGTEGAQSPFFSPDSQWIAFFAGGKLKKVAVTGGQVVTICDAASGRGGAWDADGTIIFAPINGPGVSLMRVSAAGGQPEPLAALAADETTQRWPQILPEKMGVLYTSNNAVGNYENASIVVRPLSGGASYKVVQRGGYYGRYLASGHLAYIHEGTLFAVPFDLARLETVGQPVAVIEKVAAAVESGGGQFSTSSAGTLVYVPGSTGSAAAPISWLDRDGKASVLRATQAEWNNLSVAPDGQRVAMEIFEDARPNVWVYDPIREVLSPLTFGPLESIAPIWTPDGRRIAFASRENRTNYNVVWQRADGSGPAQRLTESSNMQFPTSWHPSGKWLAFTELNSSTGFDLMILPIEGDEASGWKPGKPSVFLKTPFNEGQGSFSPDGRWLAYSSNESGRIEVYVRPFPGPGGKSLISTDGGVYPTWSPNRRELLYGSMDQRIMIVPYTVTGESFRAEKPHPWPNSSFEPRSGPAGLRPFAVDPDGDRIALATSAHTPAAQKLDIWQRPENVVFVFNFFDELRRIAPVRR